MTLGQAFHLAAGLKKGQLAAAGFAFTPMTGLRLRPNDRPEDLRRNEPEPVSRFKLEPEPPSGNGLHFDLPVQQGRISSRFGQRMHPTLHRRKMHTGVDIAAASGTPILAPAAGRVIAAGWRGGYGLTVILDHGNGYSSLYAHMSAMSVGVGDRVVAGTMLGQVGSTGRATGSHVHFEVRHQGTPVNPMGE